MDATVTSTIGAPHRVAILIIVLVASVLVGAAETSWWLIGARGLQGIGAAILGPSSLPCLGLAVVVTVSTFLAGAVSSHRMTEHRSPPRQVAVHGTEWPCGQPLS